MSEKMVALSVIEEVVPGHNGWPIQGQWRYADYLRLPNDGKRYEIIDGVLYVANAPGYDHQFAVTKLTSRLDLFVTENNLGVVLSAPFEVHLSETSRPVQPDVVFIRAEHQPQPGAQLFEGAPDLIIEVISPGSFRLDRKVKFDAYEQARVPEYWLADPKTRSIEVYTLARGEYALYGQFTGNESIRSKVLEGIAIIASSLFSS